MAYRNKLSYTLAPADSLTVSDIALPEVNALALAVHDFATNESRWPMQAGVPFAERLWLEVQVKVTRSREAAVKLTMRCGGHESRVNEQPSRNGEPCGRPATSRDWEQADLSALVQRLTTVAAASGVALAVVVGHWTANASGGKPSKAARSEASGACADDEGAATANGEWYDVHFDARGQQGSGGDGTVEELTPNGLPFRLSCDAFSEVNHAMETAMAAKQARMLGVPLEPASTSTTANASSPSSSSAGRFCFMTGRDVNCVYSTWRHVYPPEHAIVACGCPRAAADATRNNLPPLLYAPKHELGGHIRTRLAAMSAAPHSWDVLVTAGRHGLHETFADALTELAREQYLFHSVIYVSCNVGSMSKDMARLRRSFFITDFESYDFFPGSNFVMTVVKLRPSSLWIPDPASVGGHHLLRRRLLVLPVGLPASGKTTIGRAIQGFLATGMCAGSPQNSPKNQKKPQQLKGGRNPPPVASVSRGMPALVGTPHQLQHVERDLLFRQLTQGGGTTAGGRAIPAVGQNKARAAVHEAFLMACRGGGGDAQGGRCDVLYLDSTNGSADARAVYVDAFVTGVDAVHTAATAANADINGADYRPVLVLELRPRSTLPAALLDDQPPPGDVATGRSSSTPDNLVMQLARRGLQRPDHPYFPDSLDGAVEKVDNVDKGMQWTQRLDQSGVEEDVVGHRRRAAVITTDTIAATVDQTVGRVCAAVADLLFVSPHLAAEIGVVDLGSVS